MDNMWWSWILTVVGLTGFILAGRKVWWCWYINIGCQALWFTYAIVTEQYGFIVASIVYAIVFTQNALRWTKEHFQVPDDELGRESCHLYPRGERHRPHRYHNLGGYDAWCTGWNREKSTFRA